ncbi:hypothetical protein KUCAC02_006104 [Chaenocephalus aceratus]|uniref:Uncharacterized protein n=1 Tax=Chaenocephalus aceratus TaxID=36190 RepID=A0ACB9WQV9_CHAAC|nr:hypothetical protein KUCAC02_006104 [Chaenocephalus aceratus]
MVIFSVYVVNKAGGLIYQYDNYVPRAEAEKTFSYPLDLVLKHHDEKVVVSYGQRDGIKVGHAVLSINSADVLGKNTAEGKDILEYLKDSSNYPVSIRFGRARLSSNEKLMLASMFHSLFAIGSQLSPEVGSSGIEMLENRRVQTPLLPDSHRDKVYRAGGPPTIWNRCSVEEDL